MQTSERINWGGLVLVLLVGLVVLIGGLYLGRWSRDSWSNVVIEIGAAAVLFALGVAIQPFFLRRLRRATESVAKATVSLETEDLRERLVQLEDITDGQYQGRQQRVERFDALLAKLRDNVSVESVGRALEVAHEYRLLNYGFFRVRTSNTIEGPELYFLPQIAGKEVAWIWISFGIIDKLEKLDMGETSFAVPATRLGTVLWMKGKEDAGQVAASLEEELIKMNVPSFNYSFVEPLNRLIESIEIMFMSRNATSDSGCRVKGRLTVLINNEWALTSEGLEAIHLPQVFGRRTIGDADNISCPTGASPELWYEALEYVALKWPTPFGDQYSGLSI